MILNFGHTLAHVVEKSYNYETYTHGQAVAFGMYLISRIGEKMNVMQKGTADKLRSMLEKFDLPYNIELSGKISDTLGLDKKNDGSDINIILLDKIGKSIIHKMPLSEFADKVEKELN